MTKRSIKGINRRRKAVNRKESYVTTVIAPTKSDGKNFDVLLSLTMLIVSIYIFYFIFIRYFDYLEYIDCQCAVKDWKYDFIRTYFFYVIMFTALDLMFLMNNVENAFTKVLSIAMQIYTILTFIVTFAYLEQLNAMNCNCAEHRDKHLLQLFNTLQIAMFLTPWMLLGLWYISTMFD
jgi:hypothetical protein